MVETTPDGPAGGSFRCVSAIDPEDEDDTSSYDTFSAFNCAIGIAVFPDIEPVDSPGDP